ncbi:MULTISPECIES: host attachment family protein [unclassified Luteimonas]|jgi:protein required for attachment to host cells|uniref:host attachment family protein n=1 Tax=unclassified Luteimonas TaxID=2629088 RepID=UPI001616BD49|nr:host attachment family protein [Luteimonas sp. RC10]MBB3345406.1 protein required for attachment to host cells [Luteimonas sp. RC10]
MTMKIPQGAMIVVANGGAARVFTNVGEAGTLALRQEALLEGMNLDDDGPAGAMPAESSASQLDEATFAKQLALGLNEGALKNKFTDLVLIADPHTLGRVRPLLHKETTQRLVADLAKDYTNLPLDAIERALS